MVVGAAWAAYRHRSQISAASNMLSRIDVWWLLVAVAAQAGSMVVFARLQRWLLRAGGVRVRLLTMVELTLAGNAMSTSLPGGPAWAATWAFGQLRRRGANRVLAGWVLLVAGALASFAIFVIVVTGSWIAGSKGPVADLRWVAGVLAAIPIVGAAGYVAANRSGAARAAIRSAWSGAARISPVRAIGRFARSIFDKLGLVHPGKVGWAEAFSLALANWLYDAATLVASIKALGIGVPWRGILVIYGLTQISASLPITPGGIGVVEGSMAALLIAYGTKPESAFAVVLLYRIVSFWGLVPIGWGSWFAIEIAQRHGLRRRAHPWALHGHGTETPTVAAIGPERILKPQPCDGCPDFHGDSMMPVNEEKLARQGSTLAGKKGAHQVNEDAA